MARRGVVLAVLLMMLTGCLPGGAAAHGTPLKIRKIAELKGLQPSGISCLTLSGCVVLGQTPQHGVAEMVVISDARLGTVRQLKGLVDPTSVSCYAHGKCVLLARPAGQSALSLSDIVWLTGSRVTRKVLVKRTFVSVDCSADGECDALGFGPPRGVAIVYVFRADGKLLAQRSLVDEQL